MMNVRQRGKVKERDGNRSEMMEMKGIREVQISVTSLGVDFVVS